MSKLLRPGILAWHLSIAESTEKLLVIPVATVAGAKFRDANAEEAAAPYEDSCAAQYSSIHEDQQRKQSCCEYISVLTNTTA